MELTPELVADCREQFPALGRELGGQPVVYFDGPAGTQVPRSVMDAISDYLSRCNANHGGLFLTSHESDAWLDHVHGAVADFLGANSPDEVAFGANMTSLTFALSRALARTWRKGDEIVVTRLEHDANFTPWVMAAEDAQVEVRYADIHVQDCTLDLDDLRRKINARTRLVAVGCASNATGTVNPVETICQWAHEAGALTFLDAVHYAPHALVDVQQFGCDFLACSAYKFFGPHVGILWGRRELLSELQPYKLRPAPDELPGRWMTGTQNHECLVGTLAAVDYLADLGSRVDTRKDLDRRGLLTAAYDAIQSYESRLIKRLIVGLQQIPGLRIWGITSAEQMSERLPTVSFTHERFTPSQIATTLGQRGIFVWHGNYYAQPLTEALELEPEGMVRVGLVHYNTEHEVDRLLNSLDEVLRG